jgi:hypothetical protein
MGYRELSRMHVQEVVRRWQTQESQRAIARGLGVARDTVRRYVDHAESLGLSQTGLPPTEAQAIEPSRLAREGLAHSRAQPSTVQLDPYRGYAEIRCRWRIAVNARARRIGRYGSELGVVPGTKRTAVRG